MSPRVSQGQSMSSKAYFAPALRRSAWLASALLDASKRMHFAIAAAIFTLGWQRALLASLGPSGLRAGRRVGILHRSAPKHQQAT